MSHISSALVDQLHRSVVERLEQFGQLQRDASTITTCATQILLEQPELATDIDQAELIQRVVDRMTGWGPLTSYLADPEITEIMVNGTASVYIERGGQLEHRENLFAHDEEIMQIVNRMVGAVGRRIDASSPMVDARLPDGSRVNAIIPPLALHGPTLTIRRFPKHPPTLTTLRERGTMSPGMESFLRAIVQARGNVVISGGTGSGKTTTLNAIAGCITPEQRLITIEDSAEMRIDHPHLVSLESRPPNMEGRGEVPIRVLLKNALRMRPDRIIVGEIRGGEALDMLQAMNTGHQGSLTTVHANTPLDALLRIETMTMMADVELPLHAIREQIRQAIQFVVSQERLPDGRRKIRSISALCPDAKEDGYRLVPLLGYDKVSDSFVAMEPLPATHARLFEEAGMAIDPAWGIRLHV